MVGGDVSCRIAASVDNHVVGLRPFDSIPIPMWPFAILERNDGQTDTRLQNWQTHIDGRAGQDKFTYDEASQRVQHGADGIGLFRTELLVLITPRAILDRTAALQVTEEFRRKVNSLIPVDSKTRARKTQPRTQSAAEGTGWSNTSTSF